MTLRLPAPGKLAYSAPVTKRNSVKSRGVRVDSTRATVSTLGRTLAFSVENVPTAYATQHVLIAPWVTGDF